MKVSPLKHSVQEKVNLIANYIYFNCIGVQMQRIFTSPLHIGVYILISLFAVSSYDTIPIKNINVYSYSQTIARNIHYIKP